MPSMNAATCNGTHSTDTDISILVYFILFLYVSDTEVCVRNEISRADILPPKVA